MEWITANWFWILFGILFIGMHLFGHGGHGGHGNHQPRNFEGEKTNADNQSANTRSSGHQH